MLCPYLRINMKLGVGCSALSVLKMAQVKMEFHFNFTHDMISLRSRIAYNHSPTSGLDGDLDMTVESWKVVKRDQLTSARVPRRTAASYGTKIQISLIRVTTSLDLASSGWNSFCTTPHASHGFSAAGAAGLP